jgi:diacylglycerol O-acyltransferase
VVFGVVHLEVAIMESLTTLDAGFLEAEDSDPHVSLAIAAVAVMDGPLPERDSLLVAIGAAPRPSSRKGTLFLLPSHPVATVR